MKRELSPIRIDPEDAVKIEEEIVKTLRFELYLPILAEVTSAKVLNDSTTDEIVAALRSGRISFNRGRFTGRFSAGLSRALRRIGCTWDKRHGSFNVPLSKLSPEIKEAIKASESAFLRVADRVDKMLDRILPEEIAEKIHLKSIYDRSIFRIDNKIKESLQGMLVMPNMTPEMRAKIAEEYTRNMRLYIQEWTQKEIVSLRERMKKNVMSGKRHEDMIKAIQRSYGVTQAKAKFLARQETNLLMTHLRKERYLDAGVAEYRWQCVAGSPDHPVRHTHKILDGKVFRWDNPPITDEHGNRNHPGEDFNCRCIARPIVRFNK